MGGVSSIDTQTDLHGFLPVFKPAGVTSFQMVRKVRHLSGVKRVGHSGTLDPFATGLLVLGLGKPYTRQLSDIVGLSKVYRLTMVFGKTTDTLDCDGTITDKQPTPLIEETELLACLNAMKGPLSQIPPAYSAKKINGQRAYKLARQGQPVDLKPASVELYEGSLLNFTSGEFPTAEMRLTCSKGFYVRSFARDIAEKMGTVGYLTQLERESVGAFQAADSFRFDDSATLDTLKLALLKGVPNS